MNWAMEGGEEGKCQRLHFQEEAIGHTRAKKKGKKCWKGRSGSSLWRLRALSVAGTGQDPLAPALLGKNRLLQGRSSRTGKFAGGSSVAGTEGPRAHRPAAAQGYPVGNLPGGGSRSSSRLSACGSLGLCQKPYQIWPPHRSKPDWRSCAANRERGRERG